MEQNAQRVCLPAILENLEKLLGFVARCAGAFSLDEKERRHLAVAAEEALVNIIRYAYPVGTGDIEITCARREGNLVLVFKDWGIPFNPLEAPEPDTHLPLEERRIGGMGILLVKKLVPEVAYRREGRANMLTFQIPRGSAGT